jgi:DNA invertase Pin-like site-specific DNA recombinase
MKVYAYVRTARAGSEATMERQYRSIYDCCERHGLKLDRSFEDAISGLTSPIDRPGWLALEAVLEEGDQLLAEMPDRISRDPVHLAATLEDLRRRGVRVGFAGADA